jgi:hypothetical protein
MNLLLTLAEPLFFGVFLLETLDAACSIDQLLLAREERVASRTDVHADFLLRGPGFELIPAGAAHKHLMVLRMDILFHIALTKTFIIPELKTPGT